MIVPLNPCLRLSQLLELLYACLEPTHNPFARVCDLLAVPRLLSCIFAFLNGSRVSL